MLSSPHKKLKWFRSGWARWVLAGTTALVATACHVAGEETLELDKTQNLVDREVEQEVSRLRKLFEKSAPRFEGMTVSEPVPDAFNDRVDQANPALAAYGGRVRIAQNTEPKRMSYIMDNSASTAELNRYVFNGLVYVDPDTLKLRPDLATHWEARDVIWLKGHKERSEFERDGKRSPPDVENNYVIGKVLLDTIQYTDESRTTIAQIQLEVDGQLQTIPGDQLREKVNDDGTYKRTYDRGVVLTFHLRKGVTFHDGEPFDADDVIFTLDTITNSFIPEATIARSSFTYLKNWVKVDDHTVRMYNDEQYFGLLESFGDSFTVLPRHVFIPPGKSFTPEEFAKAFRDHPAVDKPVGTGPYAFPSELVKKELQDSSREAWQRGNYVRVIRTGEFWDPYRRGYLDEIAWNFYSGGGEVILRAMNNQEADFTRFLGSEEIFKKSNFSQFMEQYAKIFFFTPAWGYFAFNCRKVYFQDKRVRQAINYIIDRRRFSDNVSYGIAIPISGSQFNFGPAYNPDVPPYPYDRQKAEQLLNEAGWVDSDGDGIRDKDGVPLELELIINTGKGTIGAGLGYMMKEDLESMGVRFELRRLEWSSLLEHIDDRKFDLYSLSYSSDIETDPFGSFHSSQWANEGQNTSGYSSPRADELIQSIRRELDEQKRMLLHRELHALLAEDAPMAFLYNYPSRGAHSRRLRNVKLSGKNPGFWAWQWYIPAELQTPEERTLARKRWGDQVAPRPMMGSEAARLTAQEGGTH